MNKESDHSKQPVKPGSQTGVQPVARNLPAQGAKADGEFVDMQDLLPVMSSFREYLDEEQKKTQSRLSMFTWVFGAIAAVLILVPVYLVRSFTAQNEKTLKAQIAAQERIAEAVIAGLEKLSDASRDLRRELAAERNGATANDAAKPAESTLSSSVAGRLAQSPSAEVMALVQPPVEERPKEDVKATEAKPAEEEPAIQPEVVAQARPEEPVAEPKEEVVVAPAEPMAPATNVTLDMSINEHGKSEIVLQNVADRKEIQPAMEEPGVTVPPDGMKAGAPGGQDLEALLQQVEKAIAEKERELKTRKTLGK